MEADVGIVIVVFAGIVAALFLLRKYPMSTTAPPSLPDLPIAPPPGFTGIPYELPVTLPVSSQGSLKDRVRFWAGYRALDAALIWGVVMTESSGNPNAQNPADPSAGLMQITPLIARAFDGVRGTDAEVLDQILDPEINLRIGTAFISHLKNRYVARYPVGEWIQAYNVGETKFDRGIRNDAYGARVVDFMKTWKG